MDPFKTLKLGNKYSKKDLSDLLEQPTLSRPRSRVRPTHFFNESGLIGGLPEYLDLGSTSLIKTYITRNNSQY